MKHSKVRLGGDLGLVLIFNLSKMFTYFHFLAVLSALVATSALYSVFVPHHLKLIIMT